jgi:hypothetical protein
MAPEHVGPRKKHRYTSPIIRQESAEQCSYNGVLYSDGAEVCQGDDLMRCNNGTWVVIGNCSPPPPPPPPDDDDDDDDGE